MVNTISLKSEPKKNCSKLSQTFLQDIEQMVNYLNFDNISIKEDSRNRVRIYADLPSTSTRDIILRDLAQNTNLGYTYTSNRALSSTGAIQKESFMLTLKSNTTKNGGSSKENERILCSNINQAIDEAGRSINICLKEDRREVTVRGVTRCVDTAGNVKKGNKADVELIDEKGEVLTSVSIKKVNAAWWHAQASYVPILMDLASSKGLIHFRPKKDMPTKFRMYDPITGEDVTKLVITDLPLDWQQRMIFGSHVRCVVAIQDFDFSKFSFNKSTNTLTIYLHTLYSDFYQVMQDDAHPVGVLSHKVNTSTGLDFRGSKACKGILKPGSKAKGIQIRYGDYLQVNNI